MRFVIILLTGTFFLFSCNKKAEDNTNTDGKASQGTKIKPAVITEKVPNDSDDPAIWYNKQDPSKSLILGNDKNKNRRDLCL